MYASLATSDRYVHEQTILMSNDLHVSASQEQKSVQVPFVVLDATLGLDVTGAAFGTVSTAESPLCGSNYVVVVVGLLKQHVLRQ